MEKKKKIKVVCCFTLETTMKQQTKFCKTDKRYLNNEPKGLVYIDLTTKLIQDNLYSRNKVSA